MEGGDDQAERDPLDGAERAGGEAAEREAGEAARRARHARDGRPYPLDGLAERIKAEGAPELAFAAEVLAELLDMRDGEALAYQGERRKLKAAGVEFIDVDNKPFYDATAPVRAKYGEKYADLIKRIEAVK